MEQTDVLVVGGGPAGSTTARFAAQAGCRTVLIEKRSEIGDPVQCAEGTPPGTLEEAGIGEGPWTAKKIDNVKLISPSGITVDMAQNVRGFNFGYVLERKLFDKQLVHMAADSGADVKLCSKATGMKRANGRVIVTYQELGDQQEIEAKIVIGADGVMSKVGRWAGIDTHLGVNDIESGIEYEMTGIDSGDDIEMFFGRCYAPGGYAWIFPKGENKANVGLAVIPRMAKNPAVYYLDKFLQHPAVVDRFKDGSIIEIKAGGVPVSGPLESAVADNVMLVGDAARQVNPLTGGGIGACVTCGKIAGQTAGEAVKGDDFSSNALKAYDDRWIEAVGHYHWKLLKAKNVYITLNDKELDRVAKSFKKASDVEFTTLGIIKAMSGTSPKLMWKLRKVL
jgi:digeranylgeranylglycerophospholipid reductase